PGTKSGDLWVVDNGTTKQVFKYTGGRDVTGSTAPVSAPLFTLSIANSNPQGIADPPPSWMNAANDAPISRSNTTLEAGYANGVDHLVAQFATGKLSLRIQTLSIAPTPNNAMNVSPSAKQTSSGETSYRLLSDADGVEGKRLAATTLRAASTKVVGSLRDAMTASADRFFAEWGDNDLRD
ncbi:MAG: hypothetical protein RIS70_4097, partial [Planctomycetota bacterium]